MIYKCDNCQHTADEADCPDAKHLSIRITPGDIYTDKECPKCGSLAFPFDLPEKWKRFAATLVLDKWKRTVSAVEVFDRIDEALKGGSAELDKTLDKLNVYFPIQFAHVDSMELMLHMRNLATHAYEVEKAS